MPRLLKPSRLRSLLVTGLISLGLCVNTAMSARAEGRKLSGSDAAPEYVLKASFLYNFAQFTTWPTRPDNLLHLCVLGPDPFGAALDSIDGKEVGTSRLLIHRTRSVETALRTCQIIFVTDSEVEDFVARPNVDSLRNGVLSIAERDGAARAGIVIGLTLEERRLGFEFNQQAAERSGVTISSKLLRLARKVY